MIRKLMPLLLIIVLIANSSALTVVENNPFSGSGSGGDESASIGSMIIIGLLGGLVVLLFYWLLMKVAKKVKDLRKSAQDFFYYKFLTDQKSCFINRDKRLKSRTWWSLWLFWKRSPVYLNDEGNFRKIGSYDGEMIKKESFVEIAVYTSLGLFKKDRFIILVPYQLRHIINKNDIGSKTELFINAVGIDEALNTDYYYLVLLKDPKDPDNKLMDFNDFLQKNFMNKYVYRQVIKDNVLEFKDNIREAVEMNSDIQKRRKDPEHQK